jgi:GT2 family glycosyltransferase
VAFTDDDCTVDPYWLTSLVRPLSDDSVVGVGGTVQPRSDGVISDYLTLHQVWANHAGGSEERPFLITANACYRTDALRAVGGFHPLQRRGGSEDIDLAWRVAEMGGNFQITADAVVHHFHRTRLRDFATMFFFYGTGHARLLAKHRIPDFQRRVWRDFQRAFSLRYFVYRARQYVQIHRLDRGHAICYAGLDQVRNLSWSLGYWIIHYRLHGRKRG